MNTKFSFPTDPIIEQVTIPSYVSDGDLQQAQPAYSNQASAPIPITEHMLGSEGSSLSLISEENESLVSKSPKNI